MTNPANNTPPAPNNPPGPTNAGAGNPRATLTPHTLNRKLDQVEQALASLRANSTTAITNIRARIHQQTPYPPSSGSDIRVHTSLGDSIVERTLGQTEALTEHIDDIDEHINALFDVIRNAHKLCRPWINQLDYTDLDKQRCIGTGDGQGAPCTQWAAPDKHGRCLDCHRHVKARRQRQWRRDYGDYTNPR